MTALADGQLLSVADAARILGISRPTAYRLIADRELPAIRLRGTIRVPAAALERWLSEQTNTALAELSTGVS